MSTGNLRANPVRTQAQARAAGRRTVRALDRTFSFAGFASTTAADIQRALANVAAIDGLVVYDVGQGSAHALVDAACRPIAYVDFGGGVTGNKHTFPPALRQFCRCSLAPVVLSHWDWDHWSSEGLAGNRWIRSHTWIAPLQNGLGPSHHAVARALRKFGTLLLWDATMPGPVSVGAMTLLRCRGSGRNHSGIAMAVDGPPGAGAILVPGDARYHVIPGHGNRFDSIVAPHHGADMRNRFAPMCPGMQHSRLVYSYGAGNTFNHAARVTRSDHHRRGWLDSSVHPIAGMDHVRQTEARNPLLGHVHLAWTSRAAAPGLTCGGVPGAGCDLGPTQT